MLLYQSIGPNPRVATMFIVEKGLTVPRKFLDIMSGENRQPEFLAKNPYGHTPVLELDDGTMLAESLAICEYLEELHPTPALIGTNAEERAETRMRVRQIDQNVVVPMVMGFRGAEGLAIFKDRLLCVPDAADGAKAMGRDGLVKLDAGLKGEWLCGSRFTLADILLFCLADFGAMVGQQIPDDCGKLKDWHARVAARPSAAISANPHNGIA